MKAIRTIFIIVFIVSVQNTVCAKIDAEKLKRKLYFTSEKLGEVTRQAHTFLLNKDNLNCLTFGKDCSTPHRDALILVEGFFGTEPVEQHLTKVMQDERIRKTEEVLRDEYDVSPNEFAAVGQHVLRLILEGYLETNRMDRQLKKLTNNLEGSYERIIKDKKLLRYLTHLYYGSIPTKEMRKKMKQLLNPQVKARNTQFEDFLWEAWGHTKRFGKGAGRFFMGVREFVQEKRADLEERAKQSKKIKHPEIEEVVEEKYAQEISPFE